MTDAELAALVDQELRATTISYPEWMNRVTNGYKGKPYDGSKTAWGRAFAGLAQIRAEDAPTTPAHQRPFDPAHPVYQPIPAGCPLYQHSTAIVAYIGTEKQIRFDTGSNSPNVYAATASDPVWNILDDGARYACRIPELVRVGSGVDGPLVILDPYSTTFTTGAEQPTEFRMWQAVLDPVSKTVSCNGFGAGSYRNDGQVLTGQTVQPGRVARALGQAEAAGSNTGSGCSYTVGMIRPVDVERGRIDHAIRVAAGFLHNARFFWPALKTEGGSNSQYLTGEDKGCPMGARVFLDHAVDVEGVGNLAAARIADPRQKTFVRSFIKALQEFGVIPLDGTDVGMNVYFEGEDSADWATLLGPKNAYGSYNDIARAVEATLPWNRLLVADPAVFNSYARI